MEESYWQEKGIYYRKNKWEQNRLTLVFVHGVSGSSSAWLSYEPIFEKKYNILIYDIRGHGMSKKYPKYSDYAVKNFAEDLYNLVSYLNISKFILISNSFSSQIALEYLKLHQDTVLGNIFTSPEIYLNESWSAKFIRPALWLVTKIVMLLPFNPKPRGHVDYSKYVNVSEWNLGRNWADLRNTGLRAHMYTLLQSFRKNQEYDMHKINVPTLIIHGELDGMVPVKNALRLKDEIKGSEISIIQKATHDSARNNTREISEAIKSFIQDHKLELS